MAMTFKTCEQAELHLACTYTQAVRAKMTVVPCWQYGHGRRFMLVLGKTVKWWTTEAFQPN